MLFNLYKNIIDRSTENIVQLLIPYKKHILTITTDNGMEFRNHKAVCKALDCTVYFADPYCSGQKGAIENTNKLLREFFPKGTDFRMVTQQQLNQAQYAINERPRKKLDFSTPKVEFFKNILYFCTFQLPLQAADICGFIWGIGNFGVYLQCFLIFGYGTA